MSRRELEEELRQRKIAMVAAIWSNSAWDEAEEADRTKAIEQIESSYEKAIDELYGAGESEDDIDENDPFWAAMKRGVDKIEVPEGFSANGEEKVADAVASDDFDQG